MFAPVMYSIGDHEMCETTATVRVTVKTNMKHLRSQEFLSKRGTISDESI